jgi:hypothetical protein
MANEIKLIYGTQKTLEANGASITSTSFAQADDAGVSSSDTGDYPDGDFALTCTFGTAPAANKAINVYVQPLNIDDTSDSPSPSANFKRHFVGAFVPNNVNTAQTLFLRAYDLPKEFNVWLENQGGQTISAGWVLKFTPRTVGPT